MAREYPNGEKESLMASIHKERKIAASPDEVWAALRDWGALHERLVPGFVTDPSGAEPFGISPETFDEALRRALSEES
jgi:hypothetical protein